MPPATGQTTCWDSSGNAIPCAGTAQDGDVRAGAPLAYVDNGDGTITDVNTALIWEKLSLDGSIHDAGNVYVWDDAFSIHVATLNSTGFAGHNDWRLPNVKELETIVDFQEVHPALSPAFNNNCSPGCGVTMCSCFASGGYWSSTSYVLANNQNYSWYVSFIDGNVHVWPKNMTNWVRAVRSGP